MKRPGFPHNPKSKFTGNISVISSTFIWEQDCGNGKNCGKEVKDEKIIRKTDRQRERMREEDDNRCACKNFN